MAVASYRELGVWQKAIDFVVEVYRLTGRFPRPERVVAVAVASPYTHTHARTHTPSPWPTT
jgi:hypothetical protein